MLMATLREGSPAPAPSRLMVASAKPFLPDHADAAGRDRAPLPPARPFALGAAANRPAGPPAAGEATAATKPAARSMTRLPSAAEPVTAAAPSPMIGPAAGFAPMREGAAGMTSGRGLY
jgi:rare lipoprotein A